MFRLVALLTIALLAGSCGQKPQVSPGTTVLKQWQLRQVFIDAGVDTSVEVFGDPYYAVLNPEWINKVWATELNKFLFDNNVRSYAVNRNDCGKFSIHGQSIAVAKYHQDSTIAGSSPAFGIFVYFDEKMSGGHALNFALVSRNNRTELAFWEPQTRMEKKLSKSEISMGRVWLLP